MPELYNLDLDEELIAHLSDSESWLVLREEGFNDVLINDVEITDIYRWAYEHLQVEGKPPSPSVLSDEFDLDIRDPETGIHDLIHRLRMRYLKEEGREALKKIVDLYHEDPTKVAKELLKTGHHLSDLLVRRGEVYGTGDLDRAMEMYAQKTQKGRGPSHGFGALDDYFHGQNGISILLGPPKTWKSWLMVNGTIKNTEEGFYPWLYPLELPAKETDMRLRMMLANVPWWKYMRDCISKDEQELLRESSEWLDERGAYRIITPPQGERSIDRLVGQAQDGGAGVVYIDQLQFVEVDGKSLGAWNEPGKYFEVLDRARNLSDSIPITFAHQFNRSIMGRESMPDVKQAKGSAAIEEMATLCLGVWASSDMRKSNRAELSTLVSRNYDFRNWELLYDLTNGCTFEIGHVIEDE